MHKCNAFTLVEMLVATALTMFIMAILSQAFVTSLDVFSQLKGLGDMENGLRTAASILRNDLAQDRFEGGRKLSDPNFWSTPPREGFFHIRQTGINLPPIVASYPEGNDFDGIPSFRATNHILYFTIRLKGNRKENYLYAPVPGNSALLSPSTNFFNQPTDALYQDPPGATVNPRLTFASQWGEVCYFLMKKGSTDQPNNPGAATGTPLYALYRAQYVMVGKDGSFTPPPGPPVVTIRDYDNISCQPQAGGAIRCFAPYEVGAVLNRTMDIGASPYPIKRGVPVPVTDPRPGSALLLTSVTNFNIRVMKSTTGFFEDLGIGGAVPPQFPASIDSSTGLTLGANLLPPSSLNYRIIAIEIAIRVWDIRTQQSRQVTVIQDL